MKPPKIKGIKKYLVRIRALIFAMLISISVSTWGLRKADLTRGFVFKVTYRIESKDTYCSYTAKETFNNMLRGKNG